MYELTKDRVLKGKSLAALNMYSQQFYNRSLAEVKDIDENFFNVTGNFVESGAFHENTSGNFNGHDMNSSYNHSKYNDKNVLLMIIDLFIEVEQLPTA